jgi:hypothetical protein
MKTTVINKFGMYVLDLGQDGSAQVLSFDAAPPKMRGLGDVIAAGTKAIGIQPCGGCKERQEALNKMVPFGNSEPKQGD